MKKLLALTLILSSLALIPQAEAATPPNVVIIMADDQRADAIGDMVQLQALIADHGTTFASAMVPTSLCCPSRASTLTGKFAHSTGVWGNNEPHGGWSAFKANGGEQSNLAVWLDAAGYRTGLIGKYLNDYDDSPVNYVPPGWDHWFGFREAAYYDYDVTVRNDSKTRHYGHQPGDYSTDVIAAEASDFIRTTTQDEPLFAYIAPYATHPPFTPAPRYVGACAEERPWSVNPGLPSFNTLPKHAPSWLARIKPWTAKRIRRNDNEHRRACETRLALDDLVASTVDALADTGRLDNTLIIYMGDNGFLWSEHRLYGKSMPYDAATHVPMLMRYDGVIAPNFQDNRIALNVDVASTIAAVTGVSFPDTEGRNLLGTSYRDGFVLEAIAKTDAAGARPAYCGWRTNWAFYVKYANGDAELYDYTTNAAGDEQRREHGPLPRSDGVAAIEGEGELQAAAAGVPLVSAAVAPGW